MTANQYKIVLSDHLYLVMRHVYPDGSSLLRGERFDVSENDESESYATARRAPAAKSQPDRTPMGDFGPTC